MSSISIIIGVVVLFLICIYLFHRFSGGSPEVIQEAIQVRETAKRIYKKQPPREWTTAEQRAMHRDNADKIRGLQGFGLFEVSRGY